LKDSIKIEGQEINQSILLKHKECQPYWFLSLGESEFAFAVFRRHYPNLGTAQPPGLQLKNSGLALPASSGIG
jgi:hypothetical protein